MNKAAAVGFAIGVVFVVGALLLYGVAKPQKVPQGAVKPRGTANAGKIAVSEESAESDSAAKVPVKTAVSEAPAPLVPQGQGLSMTRSVTPGGYRTGQALDVSVNLKNDGTEKVTALALVERLPKGWSFQEMADGAKPVIIPTRGTTGELTFVWVQVPAFPCTVSYRVVPGPEVAGPQMLEGQAVYRQLGPEQRTEPFKTVVTAATP